MVEIIHKAINVSAMVFLMNLAYVPAAPALTQTALHHHEDLCPIGARMLAGRCYCLTTGKMLAVDPNGECPDNPRCQESYGPELCDGNPYCCCAISDEIYQGEQCKGCRQLSFDFCY